LILKVYILRIVFKYGCDLTNIYNNKIKQVKLILQITVGWL